MLGLPGAFRLNATVPPPVPRCVLPSAGPAELGGAGRVPVRVAVLCPPGLPTAVAAGPVVAVGHGRVGGKPRQHRSDRLGLLLRKPAASLTAQQLHLVGEPRRPWSWPSTTAAALAGGGLACRWCGPRIGVGHARLLARPRLLVPPAESSRPRLVRVGVSHPVPILSRLRYPGRSRIRLRPRRRAQPVRPRSSAKAARRRGVERAAPPQPRRTPASIPARQPGWLGSPSATGQRMLAGTARLPPWWRRIGSITRRSATVQAVSGSFIRRSPAIRRRGGRPGDPRNIERPPSGAGVPTAPTYPPALGWARLWHAERPPRSTASSALCTLATAPTASPCRATAAARRSPGIPCGYRRTFGSQLQSGQLPHQPPAADPKLGAYPPG